MKKGTNTVISTHFGVYVERKFNNLQRNFGLEIPSKEFFNSESGNARKGKFSPDEVELVTANLPAYFSDVARFGYQSGARATEILELKWSFLDRDAIVVPGNLCKNRDPHAIAITEEIEEILERQKARMVPGCESIFHRNGKPILDYEKIWNSTCVAVGLGRYFCRDCRDSDGKYVSVLDANKRCPRCTKRWDYPKYIGKIFNDFRRSCAHELVKAGCSREGAMQVTGHKSMSMFKRYSDLFSEEELRQQQRDAQRRRSEFKQHETNQGHCLPHLSSRK